jgi:2-polyprenyl-3-methyl-5-hydroxy-6-metoxy-1,4-benzoquinol methylase
VNDAQLKATWDAQAASFDSEADHGLTDPLVRAAWRTLLEDLLPPAPSRIVDLGCGTGSLSVLLAEMGHDVAGFDFAPAMIELARAKATQHNLEIPFAIADVSAPPIQRASVDVVLVRHVVWALPDPDAAIATWVAALVPGGRMVLIEGFWSTGGGMHGEALMAHVARHSPNSEIRFLNDEALWGSRIDDERYAIVARA